MDKIQAENTLNQILLQSVTDEEYYRSLEKVGISMQDWPVTFTDARRFDALAKTKTFRTAKLAVPVSVPSEFWSAEKLDLEDTKMVYRPALEFLIGLELGERILTSPGRFRELIASYAATSTVLQGMYRTSDVIAAFVKEAQRKAEAGQTLTKIRGLEILSETIGGFEPGRIGIITAPTGFGKTNMALAMYKGATDSDLRTLFVNMEMSIEDMGKRLIQAVGSATSRQLEGHNFLSVLSGPTDIAGWAVRSHEHWITDGSALSLSEIERKIIILKREQALNLVLVDYDQKVFTESRDEEWRTLQKTVERLEEVAKRESLHVTLFSQSNDEGVPRASIRAMQPASYVGFFHKDDDKFKIKFLKNRYGPTNRALLLDYHPEVSRITERELEDASGTKADRPRDFAVRTNPAVERYP